MKKPESICIFGDSTAWGAWDLEGGGWAGRLWRHVGAREEDYVEIYNLSVSGGTTETILQRFERESKIRNADALIFQTGGNDASFEISPDKPRVSPEKFRKNLEKVIKKAKKITPNIIFLDLKNCDESKTTPVSWINLSYTNANLQKYNQIMKEVAEKNKILFIDLFGLLNNDDFYDGLHPNAAGHEKIFIKVRDFLATNNWI